MKFSLWPHKRLGKFSLGAFVIFLVVLIIRILHLEYNLFQTRIDDMLVFLIFFIEYIAGAVTWLSGLISIIVYKERSILVWAYTAVPVIAVIFIMLSNL